MNNMEFTIAISTYFVFNFVQLAYFFFASGTRLYRTHEMAGNILARENMDMHDRHH